MANVGDYLTIKGVKKRWAGENYGWQTPASYSQLEKQGKFKVGAQFLDRLGSYLGPAVKNVQNFQEQVRKATPFLDPIDRAVGGAMRQEDRLPSSVVARGGVVAAQRAGNALNIDPRLAGIGGLLIGGVHTSGPKAGTYKWRPTGDLKPYADIIEERIEAAHQHFQKHKSLKGFNTSVQLPDGRSVRISNKGNVSFDGRTGLSPVATTTKPKPTVTSNAATPVPEVRRQLVEDYGVPEAAADDLLRYQPKPTPPGKTITREEKVALINPDPNDLKSKTKEFYSQAPITDRRGVLYSAAPGSKMDRPYSVPASDKQVKVTQPDGTSSVLKIEGAKTIQERVRQIPGMEDVVIDSMQAHHRFVLKESTDFMQYFDDPSIVRRAYEDAGIHPGDDVMQRVDLPVRLHQTDPSVKYYGYREHAAHERLQARPGTPEHAAGTPIQAEPGMSRWGHLMNLPNDKARERFIKQHIEDLKKSEKIALEAYYQQFLVQPGREQFGVDPYIGNFAQQVLAPHNIVGDIIRQSYVNRRNLQINGP
jgi:hypothetical protein